MVRLQIFLLSEKLSTGILGPLYRRVGQAMYRLGVSMSQPNLFEDRLVPSLRRLSHNNRTPNLEQANFVAPNATVLGDVELGEGSSIWYGATVLGTLPIRIGSHSVIQDRVHISRETKIGNSVYVGPNSILQGSHLQNRAFVAMGATVRHATVEPEGIVAAGAVVPDNVTIPSMQIWAGNPARYIRTITPIEKQILRQYLEQNQQLAKIHQQQTSRSFRELLSLSEPQETQIVANDIANEVDSIEMPDDPEDEQFLQQRLFMKEKITEEHDDDGRGYDPYEYDMSKFPDEFQVGTTKAQMERVRLQMEKKEFKDRKPWTQPF